MIKQTEMQERKVIKISGQVYQQLEKIKKKEGHTSIDSVIRTLLDQRGK